MDRRFFAMLVGAVAGVGLARGAWSAPEDVQAGCEGAVAALKGWLKALASRDFDYLEQHLASDFQFTFTPNLISPGADGGVKDKPGFIEQDRHVYNSDIRIQGLTARRMGDLVVTVVFAHIANEEFRGDLGTGLPSASQMNAGIHGKTLGYASGWRERNGLWQCTSHHVLGAVNQG
jgi:hypothetical protein